MKKIKTLIHNWAWTLIITFCLAGLFYPKIGIVAIGCMLAPVAVAFFKGRLWCGSFCPRGSFNDILLKGISRKKPLPKFLKSQWFRIIFLVLLMSGFAVQLYYAWGDLVMTGGVFVRMIIITTLLTILLGTIYNHRTWCSICPMGTMAHYVTRLNPFNKKINHVTFDKKSCVNCKVCNKNCPIGINVLEHKEHGKVSHADCIKCQVCVDKCPKKSLHVA